MTEEKKQKNLVEDYDILGTKPFKLKNKPGRMYQIIDLKSQFGIMPELISVEKVIETNNTFIVRAFIPKKKDKKTKEKKTE